MLDSTNRYRPVQGVNSARTYFRSPIGHWEAFAIREKLQETGDVKREEGVQLNLLRVGDVLD
jgi:hypothetical protein